MKSSSGAHYIALDHVRALAIFIVFTWHFLHWNNGQPVPFNALPIVFPLVLLDEGHTGVSLFMALSGYLFAKLLDGKKISYPAFLWNRAVRLLPLLALVVLFIGLVGWANGADMVRYAWTILLGAVYPTLPNGGWSITVEFHFYLLLPLFLWLVRRSRWLPLLIVAAAILLRAVIHQINGSVEYLAYWTLVGRVDQFTLGMLAFHFRDRIAHRHWLALGGFAAFVAIYWYFDSLGGLYNIPGNTRMWIILPTIEGLTYGLLIAWYDSSFSPTTTGLSGIIGRVGEASYSIYLLHFSFVMPMAWYVHHRVMDISNFYLACAWSLVCFSIMAFVAYWLSYRMVELPFLRLRRSYLRP